MHLNGTEAKKGTSGTANTSKKYGKAESLINRYAAGVARNTKRKIWQGVITISAVGDAKQHFAENGYGRRQGKMRIKSITFAGEADAYNMEVEDTHDYAVAGGVISHNCRYVCMENPIAPRPKKEIKPKPYNPLDDDQPALGRYEWYRRY